MRRGFSLLELMVAVGLVVVIAALAAPALLGRIHAARMDTALRQIGAAVTSCRAEAQRSGQALELRVVQVGGGSGKGAGGLAMVMEPVTAGAADEQARSTVVPWSMLPAGVKASPRRPEVVEPGPRVGVGVDGGSAGERVELDERSWRMGVFLPDGSVVTSGPVYLTAGREMQEVKLNRWTGGVSASEVEEEPEEES